MTSNNEHLESIETQASEFLRSALAAMRPGQESFISRDAAAIIARAMELARSDIQPSSQKTYGYLVRAYEVFCDARVLDPFAPFSVIAFVVDRIDANEPKSTLRGRLAAIRRLAKDAGLPDPTADPIAARLIANAFRALAPRQPRRATPATYELLTSLVGAIDDLAREAADLRTPVAASAEAMRLRDRALILFGFALGRRGAELARIETQHLTWTADGVLVQIPYSKMNRSGEPEVIGTPAFADNPLCPVRALKAWLDYANIENGPVFRTCSPVAGRGDRAMRGEDISRRIEAIAQRAGLDGFWRSHSLRRGVVTSAERQGVARSRTRMLTGWKNDAMFAVYRGPRRSGRRLSTARHLSVDIAAFVK